MDLMEHLVFNIIFMPLLGAFASYFGGKKLGDRFSQVISSVFMVSSAIFSVVVFQDVVFEKAIYQIHLLDWIQIGDLKSNWSLYVDSVTAVMLLVVTSVSAVVHLYSIGYMMDDNSIPRFMSYLSLFTFFMLMLVTSDNILQLFFGWEGVGLCSYLLIGFWHHKPSANAAAIKAFIVNRVGDFAFMLGIATLFMTFDTIHFKDIFTKASQGGVNVDLICLLLFIGAMGKSAQIGLHTWLADAMEGPTPVSALIHAATMVTAGVFLVIRFSPLFELSPSVLTFITYIGAITAAFAASIALVQNDIKKIIAYSTCSQLGYMFFACGVGAYPVALFHLMTHAFFKALLFLGAGNVIHSMHHEQDIRKMGGLWNKVPVTYGLMLIGSLALAGIYPFAGYFSKDLIIEVAYAKNSNAGLMAFTLGLVGAVFTAFYSWRLLFLTFHGKCQYKDAHEAPRIMIYPLFILAFGAIFSGVLAVKMGILTSKFWGSSLVVLPIIEQTESISEFVKLMPLFLSGFGILMAYLFYIKLSEMAKIFAHSFSGLYLVLQNKYYIDEIYNFIFIRPFKYVSNALWKICDGMIIDDLGPNGVANISNKISGVIAKAQSGYIYHYILVMIIGLVSIITYYIIFSS
ncbi:MAG: NADH-quinone oxidoreductase subunit L [Rickettsiales bacterium]|jgi:NADH-quinone oxidoreductase subunit L|nr:NADH-quinone oxidoreductase subunit L [Rickettsiales bacterium]